METIETNEIASTFYALRLLSHGLDSSQIKVTTGDEYPSSEFTKEEQEQGLEILRDIEASASLSISQLSADQIHIHLTELSTRIEDLTNTELVKAGYALEGTVTNRLLLPQFSISSQREKKTSRERRNEARPLAENSGSAFPLNSYSQLSSAAFDLRFQMLSATFAEDRMIEPRNLARLSETSDVSYLLDELHDLYKIEAGRERIDVSEISVDQVAGQVERIFQLRAREKNLQFVIEKSETLAPTIHTDDKRLHYILMNLLSNAFQFTQEGRVTLRIAPAPRGETYQLKSLKRAAEVVAFSISDTGGGIPPEKQAVIFETFKPTGKTKGRRARGAGLGLTLSREIAKLLRGEIHVVSSPGEGSTFTFYLPQS